MGHGVNTNTGIKPKNARAISDQGALICNRLKELSL